tara:strand:- start:261 stop:1121 length:861 start_codon:yes stop_codon:yes gene_type:complete
LFYKRDEVRDLLASNNLRLVADENGKPLLDMSGKRGILSVESVEPDSYTPQALRAALDGQERVEKEFIQSGERPLSTDNKAKDSDYKLARLIATHLTGDSLKMLSDRGLHGRYAGDRMKMEEAVQDLLYKGSFGRDLYTDTYTGNMETQMGHTVPNDSGGQILRPELAAINMAMQKAEGHEKLEAIRRKRVQLNAMEAIQDNPELLNDPDVAKYVMGDKTFMKGLLDKAVTYGFDVKAGASTRTDSPGANRERSLNINSGGGDVTIEEGVLRSNGKNGNGNGNGKH